MIRQAVYAGSDRLRMRAAVTYIPKLAAIVGEQIESVPLPVACRDQPAIVSGCDFGSQKIADQRSARGGGRIVHAWLAVVGECGEATLPRHPQPGAAMIAVTSGEHPWGVSPEACRISRAPKSLIAIGRDDQSTRVSAAYARLIAK